MYPQAFVGFNPKTGRAATQHSELFGHSGSVSVLLNLIRNKLRPNLQIEVHIVTPESVSSFHNRSVVEFYSPLTYIRRCAPVQTYFRENPNSMWTDQTCGGIKVKIKVLNLSFLFLLLSVEQSQNSNGPVANFGWSFSYPDLGILVGLCPIRIWDCTQQPQVYRIPYTE